MKKIKITVCVVLAFCFIAVIAYSGYQIWQIQSNYNQEARIHDQLMIYKPSLPQTPGDGVFAPKVNQAVVDMQARYPDAVGWITIPNTKIDYPFVQATDNDFYLHRDLDKNYLYTGTVFMDYRNHKDFSDFNTIIFGHHMKNGSMFGTLQDFNDQSFFNANKTGTIFLADKTYTIEFFAWIVLKPNDAQIYDPTIVDVTNRQAFLDHAKSMARYYRDLGVTPDDHLVTLSTCNYEFDNAREVLIGRLAEA